MSDANAQVRDVSNLFVAFRYDNCCVENRLATFAYVLIDDDKPCELVASPSTKAATAFSRPAHESPNTIPTANARLPSLSATKRKKLDANNRKIP